jgi:soluble lytic murein transglycosylase-like protein
MRSFHYLINRGFIPLFSVLLLTLWGSLPVHANALRNTIYDVQIRKWNGVYNPSIPWTWAKAQLIAESRLNTNATSPVGAMGLGQFMPDTWSQMTKELKLGNVSAYASSYNLQAHAYYMRQLRAQFKRERPEWDRHSLALASYNAGLGNILKAQQKGGNSLLYAPMAKALPQVTGHHSKETTDYVQRIWEYVDILNK